MSNWEIEFAKFRAQFRGLANKYVNCEENLTVYHYTNIQGFKGIIESGNIYFSSMNALNDETETYYIWKLINKNKEILFENENKEYRIFINKFFQYIEIEKILTENVLPNYDLEVYSASFSFSKDSLPNWRGYTDGARLGCCIEFQYKNVVENFLDLLRGNSGVEILDDKYRLALFSAGKIIYDKNAQLKEIRSTLKKIYGLYTDENNCKEFLLLKNHNEFLKDKDFEQFVFDEMYKSMRILNIFFKDNCFSTEDEYRIIFPTSKYIESPFKIEYRTTENYLIPYIEVKYPKDSIKEVMLAPINKNSNSRLSIENFLKDNGINAKVTYSKLPLRF